MLILDPFSEVRLPRGGISVVYAEDAVKRH